MKPDHIAEYERSLKARAESYWRDSMTLAEDGDKAMAAAYRTIAEELRRTAEDPGNALISEGVTPQESRSGSILRPAAGRVGSHGEPPSGQDRGPAAGLNPEPRADYVAVVEAALRADRSREWGAVPDWTGYGFDDVARIVVRALVEAGVLIDGSKSVVCHCACHWSALRPKDDHCCPTPSLDGSPNA